MADAGAGAGIVARMYGTLRGSGMTAPWWLLTIGITSGTNLLDFFAATQPDALTSLFFLFAVVVRILLVFWLAYALLRRLGGLAAPLRIGAPFFRFALFAICTIALIGLSGAISSMLTSGLDRPVLTVIGTYVVLTLIVMALVRLYAWQAALAIGDRKLGASGAWRSLAPEHGRLALGYVAILPVAIVHATLTHFAVSGGLAPAPLALLAIVDGIVSAVQLVLAAALAVIAWRIATAKSGALREEAALA